MGRDGYIAYNNAGFWKENIKQIFPKEKFPRKPFAVFRSLRNIPPIWTYYSDGSGRDSYIYYNGGGLKKNFSPLSGENLQKYLREKIIDKDTNHKQNVILSKDEKIYLNKINQIQKDLVNRLYNKYKFNNNNINDSKMDNNDNMYDNTLHRSSSQITGRQTLHPIQYKFDTPSNTLNRNDSFNFKSRNNNNLLTNRQLGSIKLKTRNINKIPWYYKKEFISNSVDHKLTRHPKVRCSLEPESLNIN